MEYKMTHPACAVVAPAWRYGQIAEALIQSREQRISTEACASIGNTCSGNLKWMSHRSHSLVPHKLHFGRMAAKFIEIHSQPIY